MFQDVRIKTKIAKRGQIKGSAQANTKNIWKRTVRRPARFAAVEAAVEAVDQRNADINPLHELWVVLKPPKELGLGRH